MALYLQRGVLQCVLDFTVESGCSDTQLGSGNRDDVLCQSRYTCSDGCVTAAVQVERFARMWSLCFKCAGVLNLPVSELNLPVSKLNLPVGELNLPVGELNLPVSELNLPVSELD